MTTVDSTSRQRVVAVTGGRRGGVAKESTWSRMVPSRRNYRLPARWNSRMLKNNAELVPFFLAGLCHPVPGVKKLTAKALFTLGLGDGGGGGGGGGSGQLEEDGERRNRCRELLQPPLLPALVTALGDGDTGAAQAVADTMVSLCEEADRPPAGAAVASSGESESETRSTSTSCRRAVLGALASQLGR